MTTIKQNISEFDQLKQRIHGKLIGKLDLSRVGELEGDVLRRRAFMRWRRQFSQPN